MLVLVLQWAPQIPLPLEQWALEMLLVQYRLWDSEMHLVEEQWARRWELAWEGQEEEAQYAQGSR